MTDATRILRIAFIIDEINQICKQYRADSAATVRTCMSHTEFATLGGVPAANGIYYVYTQLVYAKRDARAYVQTNSYPSAKAIQKYAKFNPKGPKDQIIYTLDVDDESERIAENARCKTKSNSMGRIAFVIYRFRKALQGKDGRILSLDSEEARLAVNEIRLTKAEFVQCGGHQTVSDRRFYSFHRQVQYAVLDMQNIMQSGKIAKCAHTEKHTKRWSAFQMYSADRRRAWKREGGKITKEMMAALAQQWKDEDEAVRAAWESRAEERKEAMFDKKSGMPKDLYISTDDEEEVGNGTRAEEDEAQEHGQEEEEEDDDDAEEEEDAEDDDDGEEDNDAEEEEDEDE